VIWSRPKGRSTIWPSISMSMRVTSTSSIAQPTTGKAPFAPVVPVAPGMSM
jgi:hypothetical protein